MATVAYPTVPADSEECAYPITCDLFEQMIGLGLIPQDRRVYVWDGRLYEKMAKSKSHAAVQGAFTMALTRRVPPGLFVSGENPVRLDDTHLPLPDLIVARGAPLDFFSTRYPDGRDVELVVEIAVTSLPEDLGKRLSRHALALPMATYVVADVAHHQLLIFTEPKASGDTGQGEYAQRVVVGRGEVIRLRLFGVELEPIPWEEVMR